MKTKLLALLLFAGSSVFAGTHFSFGVRVGPPAYYYAPPPVYYAAPPPAIAYVPPCPGFGYVWVAPYRYRVGPRWAWRAGYWRAPRPYYRGYYGRYGYWR